MPQMSPIQWPLIYTMVIMTIMMTWIIIYFQIDMLPKNKKIKKTSTKTMNWKW